MLIFEFDETIDLTQKCMRSMGIWPEYKQNYSSWLRFIVILFTMLLFSIIPQAAKVFFGENDLDAIIEILNLLIITFVAWCKFFNTWLKTEGKTNF